MAAFTEGYSDIRGEGKQTEHLGKVISKVLVARQLAQEERRKANKKLWEQDASLSLEDFGITRGYFFKKALQHEFGGDFVDQKKDQLKKLINTRRILKSKKKLHVTAVNFLRDNTRFSSVNPQSAARFRKKFDYNLQGGDPIIDDSSANVGSVVSGPTKRATKQDFLVAVTEIAQQLQNTAESINRTVDKSSTIASSVASMQKNVVVEISNRTDQVSDRLEAISNAINQQTEFLRRSKEQEKNKSIESAAEKQRINSSSTFNFDASDTKQDETLQASTSEQMLGKRQETPDPWGTAEKGAIITGDKGGYDVNIGGVPIEAHGTELVKPIGKGKTAIIPLDNYATDGIQGNEVTGGGDLTAEQGIVLPKVPALPPLPNVTAGSSSTPLVTSSSSVTDDNSQSLLDAMQLPFKAVGGGLINIVSQIRNSIGSVYPAADSHIENIQNIISRAFNLPKATIQKSNTKFKADRRFINAKFTTLEKGEDEDKIPWYKQAGEWIGNFTSGAVKMTKDFFSGLANKANNIWKMITGQNKNDFSRAETASILFDELKKQGLSDEGAALALAEFSRETNFEQKWVLGSHDDGGVTAVGGLSWQGGRDENFLKHGGFKDIKEFSQSGEKGIRSNASFMVKEIAQETGGTELLNLLKKPNLTEEEQQRVRQLFKESYLRYDSTIPLSVSEQKLMELPQILTPPVKNDQASIKNITSDQKVAKVDNFSESSSGGIEVVFLNLGADESLNVASTMALNSSANMIDRGYNNTDINTFFPHSMHV